MIARTLLKPLGALLLLVAATASAHEGEDHAEDAQAATAPSASQAATSGRFVTQGGGLELVAAASGHDLTVWIDRWADNVPVTNARVNVTVDGRSIEARPINGTYILDAPTLDAPGPHRLSFAVTTGDAVQRMAGILDVASTTPAEEHAHLPWRTILIVLLALGVVVGAFLLWRARRRGPAVALVLAGILVQPVPIFAH